MQQFLDMKYKILHNAVPGAIEISKIAQTRFKIFIRPPDGRLAREQIKRPNLYFTEERGKSSSSLSAATENLSIIILTRRERLLNRRR